MTTDAFIDLAVTPGEQGREDTQGCWQGVVAGYLNNGTVLDVGAGLGKSKGRMSIRGLTVTTQDPGPGLPVDTSKPVSDIEEESFDYVTAFDVIEHIKGAEKFLLRLREIARKAVILTTPNRDHTRGTHVYHWREYLPSELLDMAESVGMSFQHGWMMFPSGPPHIREATEEDFRVNRFCYNYCLVLRK